MPLELTSGREVPEEATKGPTAERKDALLGAGYQRKQRETSMPRWEAGQPGAGGGRPRARVTGALQEPHAGL